MTTASGSFQTPNWPQTYDNNIDCEWLIRLPDASKLVEITCGTEAPYGIAGSHPSCTKDYITLYDGHSTQSDYHGPYCGFTPQPGTIKMSSNLAKVLFHAGPSHSDSRRGVKCTYKSMNAPLPPTTPPPTTPPPTLPPTTPPPAQCGGSLTTASGSFQTPNWPQTYDNNIDCEWLIRLPDASKLVEITCGTEAPYGIAGSHPSCTKDYITLYDGHSTQSDSHGPYCGFTPQPGTIKMSSNLAKVLFHAGPSHSDSRRGVKCTYKSINAPLPPTTPPPTTPPPTTPPPTLPPTTPPSAQCGGSLTTASGSFQTPNWPETYDNNIDCEWRITLPDLNKLIEIKCEDDPFGIAGTFPECAKDHLKVYDGHSTQDTLKGTFCHFTKPDTMTMSSNRSMAVFHAGPNHSSSRKGFRCTFTSVNPPTVPPTSTSQCGGTLTAASGSLQTPNWPETYPVDVTCVWNIQLPDTTKRVEITFAEGFGIAGNLPDCSKDHLHVHDDSAGTQNGPYCHFTLPPVLMMSSNQARLVFYAGERHSSSRRGFKASYRSV